MKVLWLTENYPPKTGGMATSCDRLVRSLSQRGITIDVVHFCPAGKPMRTEQRLHGLHIACPIDEEPGHAINLAWNIINSKQNSVAAGEKQSAQPYTHVIAFGGWLPMIAAPVFAAWLQAPLITMLRGNDFDIALFSPRRGEVLREALKRSAHVCTVSQDQARKVSLLFPQLDVSCTANGIDLSQWQATDTDREIASARRLEIFRDGDSGSDKKILGLFGHLKAKKGTPFFIDALIRSGFAARFHLMLVGEVESETAALLTRAQQSGALTFHVQPYIDRFDLIPLYLACDWLVIPSFYDGFPNVLLEAGALAVPVLASRIGGMADVLHSGKNAVLFETGDSASCRIAITRAAQLNDNDRLQLGANLSTLVRADFAASNEAERYICILRKTMQLDRNGESVADNVLDLAGALGRGTAQQHQYPHSAEWFDTVDPSGVEK